MSRVNRASHGMERDFAHRIVRPIRITRQWLRRKRAEISYYFVLDQRRSRFHKNNV